MHGEKEAMVILHAIVKLSLNACEWQAGISLFEGSHNALWRLLIPSVTRHVQIKL